MSTCHFGNSERSNFAISGRKVIKRIVATLTYAFEHYLFEITRRNLGDYLQEWLHMNGNEKRNTGNNSMSAGHKNNAISLGIFQ